LELGTLGRGNHFLELQRDDSDRLWIILHSGSRAMGPAIRKHHESRAKTIVAETEAGGAYVADLQWAIAYARANRARMLEHAIDLMREVFGALPDESTRIECDHNHVRREVHGDRSLWVHRKGALSIPAGALGVVPGSMGSASFHVEGRGCLPALCSCAHGAGRAMSRGEAKRRITLRQLDRETKGVWFDRRIAKRLVEEAPSAYKDISTVMRAQQDLVRVVRKLEPLLVYKGV
jgi:tRNA-splicing ligase RtcB